MNRLLLTLLLTLSAGLGVYGAEVEDALKTVDAPGGDFVRMPAKYIFQRLEKQAHRSGIPVLGGFSIEVRMDGAESKKITVSFEGMNMVEALNACAKATGTGLKFDGTIAVMGDANEIVVSPVDAVEEPEQEDDEEKEVEFTDVDSALVFVETGVGRGSAFIAEQADKPYLFSNQHNFMGATRLELHSMHAGEIEYETFEFCRSRDLVRFELDPEKMKDLAVMKMSAKSPYIGQSIVVYGNSAGGNVATELRGEVLGVGPRDIEVDTDIVSGNSGSPILDDDGQVLGVATYVAFELQFDKKDQRSQIFKGTRFGKTRRYGVRIPDDGWVKVDIRQFLNQTYEIADTKNYLEIMHVLVEYWNGNEDYIEPAELILSSFSSRSDRVTAPYGFHFPKTEEDVRLMVKAFKRNHEEFRDIVQDMDLSKKDIAKLTNPKSRNSSSKLERLDYHIRTSMLGKAKRMQDELKKHSWMSEYLRESSDPLEKLASELVRILESEKHFRDRIEAVK